MGRSDYRAIGALLQMVMGALHRRRSSRAATSERPGKVEHHEDEQRHKDGQDPSEGEQYEIDLVEFNLHDVVTIADR